MSSATRVPPGADYGIDAPGVIRNLLIVAALGFGLWVSEAAHLWSGRFVLPIGSTRVIFDLATSGLWAGAGCAVMAGWMFWSSKFGKVRTREHLLQRINWRGDEQVLDVGCGRGLMLIGAAKRLTTGKAFGIDLWKAEDLSGNRPEATEANVAQEGVADRVEVRTADMRKLPFPDATFDVVVSRAAIHNLYSAGDRAKAIAEVARVLKPGGQAIIDDIRHHHEYVATLADHGCGDVRWVGSQVISVALTLITMGALRPATLIVRKAT